MMKLLKNVSSHINEREEKVNFIKSIITMLGTNEDIEIIKEGLISSGWSFEDDIQIIFKSKKAEQILKDQDRFRQYYAITITPRKEMLFEFFIHQNENYGVQHKQFIITEHTKLLDTFEKIDKYLSKLTVERLSKLKKFNK